LRPVVLVVLVAALVAGCGSAASSPDASLDRQATQSSPPTVPPSPSPSAVPSQGPTPPPARPTPTPTPVGDPIPAELLGLWQAELPQDTPRYASYGTSVDFTMAPDTYRIKVRLGQITGRIAMTDGELVFTNGTEDNCAGSGTGRYSWEIVGDQLTFTPVVPDECPARATFFELTHTRQP
jgi:hypothetical protein